MSSWNVALEQHNRLNNNKGANGGAFAIPSKSSPDYGRVLQLAEQIRMTGRVVKWEEMNFPDLKTQIGRPARPCPGYTPSSSLGSTVPYSDGSSRSTPSRSSTGSTVPQSQGPSRAPTPSREPVRRTLDFIDTDIPTFAPGQWNPYIGRVEGLPPRTDIPQRAVYNPYGVVNIPRPSTSGGYNPQTMRFDIPD